MTKCVFLQNLARNGFGQKRGIMSSQRPEERGAEVWHIMCSKPIAFQTDEEAPEPRYCLVHLLGAWQNRFRSTTAIGLVLGFEGFNIF